MPGLAQCVPSKTQKTSYVVELAQQRSHYNKRKIKVLKEVENPIENDRALWISQRRVQMIRCSGSVTNVEIPWRINGGLVLLAVR